MSSDRTFDFWYAVNNTEIVRMPTRHLETFGSTMLNYHLITELMDEVGQVRVREGRIKASPPHIVTPQAYSTTVLEGFGEEARNYVDWLKEHEKDVRVLQYGYTLKQQEFSEHIITDNKQNVVDRVKKEVEDAQDPLGSVVIGVEEPWDVCLVKLFWEVIQKSAATNIREMEQRKLFDRVEGVPRGIRNQVEDAFSRAAKDPAHIDDLGKLLQRLKLFEEYEDRFFSLIRKRKR